MKKSEHQKRVELFMNFAGQDTPQRISKNIPRKVIRLRASLILEECLELLEGLGYKLIDNKLIRIKEPDLVAIIDGACDLKVVTTGTLSAFGIPDECFQELIDENNLRKTWTFDELSSASEKCDIKQIDKTTNYIVSYNGKLLKPPSHKSPNIKKLLNDCYNS